MEGKDERYWKALSKWMPSQNFKTGQSHSLVGDSSPNGKLNGKSNLRILSNWMIWIFTSFRNPFFSKKLPSQEVICRIDKIHEIWNMATARYQKKS